MSSGPVAKTPAHAIGLLERAVGYARGSLLLVTPRVMTSPTPCGDWDVRDLLSHMLDSLTALTDAAALRRVALAPGAELDVTVDALRVQACALLAVWTACPEDTDVSVGGRRLPLHVVASTGALEVAIHGWDLAVGCGRPRPLPGHLAAALLDVAPLVLDADDRPGRFAAPVDVRPSASAEERLLAFLGRRAR